MKKVSAFFSVLLVVFLVHQGLSYAAVDTTTNKKAVKKYNFGPRNTKANKTSGQYNPWVYRPGL